MVIHELATNSVKHGALSSDYGMLDITGVIKQDKLELIWAETGGPVVDEPPVLNGFGSKMLVNIIEAELKGAITYSWYPSGLVALVTADLEALAI
jgi:two-component sensor histidine kinase